MRLRFNDFRLDADSRLLVTADGTEVPLTPKVRDLLVLFLRNAGTVLSRQHLLEAVWPDQIVADHVLTFQISELRKALGTAERLLKTIPKAGYRWDGEGPRVEPAPAAVPDAASPAPSAQAPPRSTVSGSLLVAGIVVGSVLVASLSYWYARPRTPAWVEVHRADGRAGIGSNRAVAGTWGAKDGALVGEGAGPVLLELPVEAASSVRIEVEATVLPGSGKGEVSVFLCGKDVRDRGYYFAFGGDHRSAEIDRNGEEEIVVPTAEVELGRRYSVVATRRGNLLELAVDGRTLATYVDPFPLGAKESDRIQVGTYDAAIALTNLRVLRERTPETVPLTLLGDRLFVARDFAAAEAEYEKVRVDHAGKAIAGEATFKIGACRLERGLHAEAIRTFDAVANLKAEPMVQSLARLARIEALRRSGELDRALDAASALGGKLTASGDRYRLAVSLLGLEERYWIAGRFDRAEAVHRLFRVRFRAFPLLGERMALRQAFLESGFGRELAPLKRFLEATLRIGKVRYEGEELLALFQLTSGRPDDALATYRALESEFAGVNRRFSLRGCYGQAMVSTLAGKDDDARSALARALARKDPYAEQLAADHEVFARWRKGDSAGAIALLKEHARLSPAGPEFRYLPLELAQLLAESGARAESEALLASLGSSASPDLATTARFLSGSIGKDAFLKDPDVSPTAKALYAEPERLRSFDALASPYLSLAHARALARRAE